MGSLDSCFRRSDIKEWLLERPKEVQDTSCRGLRGVPQHLNSPKTGGHRGLREKRIL